MDYIIKEKSGCSLKGVYKFTKAKIHTPEQWKLHDKIVELQDTKKDFLPLVRQLNSICETEVFEVENIIPTVGRKMVADNLTNVSPDDTMYINYTALGTGTTAVANSDTKLVTESFRKATASSTNADNVGYVTAFYAATDCNGTYKEHGLFSNGVAGADTGILFSRVLLNAPTGIAKAVTETLTIDYTITIS